MTRRLIALGVLGFGLTLAACETVPPPPPPPAGHHIRWCLNHHPGYNPNTNLWPDAYGHPRPCRHP